MSYVRTSDALRRSCLLSNVLIVACGGDLAVLDSEPQSSAYARPILLDTMSLTPIPNVDDESHGIFTFSTEDPLTGMQAGDIIVSTSNGGMFRAIENITRDQGRVSFGTRPAALTEVIENGILRYSTDEGAALRSAPAALLCAPAPNPQVPDVRIVNGAIHFDDLVLWGSRQSGLVVTGGVISIDPTLELEAEFRRGRLHSFRSALGGTVTLDADVSLGLSGRADGADEPVPLASCQWPFVAPIPIGPFVLPVAGRAIIRIALVPTVSTEFQARLVTGISASGSLLIGAEYQDGAWSAIEPPVPSFGIKPLTVEVGGGTGVAIAVRIESEVRLYETIAPKLWLEPKAQVEVRADLAGGEWTASCWWSVSGGASVAAKILDNAIAEWGWERELIRRQWPPCEGRGEIEAPGRLVKVSGDSQHASAGSILPEPLVVRVLSATGSPLRGVSVGFTTPDGGTLTPMDEVTSDQGLIRVVWRLGTSPGMQRAVAAAPGYFSSPIVFIATAANTGTCIPTAIGMGEIVLGELAPNDCKFFIGTASNQTVADLFTTLVDAAQAIKIVMNGSPAVRANVNIDGSSRWNSSHLDSPRSFTAIVPAGRLYLWASGAATGIESGAYALTVLPTNSVISGCQDVVLAANVRTVQRLSNTDCDDSGFRADRYQLAIPPRWTATATMRSSEFDPYLVLRDGNKAFIAFDDDGAGGTDAKLTYTNSSATHFLAFYLHARAYRREMSGEYTLELILSPPPGEPGMRDEATVPVASVAVRRP